MIEPQITKNMRIRIALAMSWLVLILMPLSAARAEKPSDKAKAKKLFSQAEAHYSAGRFAQALDAYSKAYEMAKLAGFLFNIGQCHRELKNYPRALYFYQGYLREKPDAKNRALVEDLIAETQNILAEQERERQRAADIASATRAGRDIEPPSSENKTRPVLPTNQPVAENARATRAPPSVFTVAAEPKTAESAPVYRKWWFWTIVGSAVAVAATGTIYAISSGGKRELPAGSMGTIDFR
jgi:tetratricopeptide (TPR) repeat protein